MQVSCDRESISFYLSCFCEAYLLYELPFFSDSLARQRVNPSKYYPVDVALVRSVSTKSSLDNGYLLETIVFLHLRRQRLELAYAVTEGGFEIDFLVRKPETGETFAVQVSYALEDAKTRERELRALRDLSGHMDVARCLVVTWDEEARFDDTTIEVVPVWRFFLDSL